MPGQVIFIGKLFKAFELKLPSPNQPRIKYS
jgi:hypothetical protein